MHPKERNNFVIGLAMTRISCKRHRFTVAVIQHAVWLFRFMLSLRDVAEMLAQRGVDVSYQTIRA